MKVIDCEKCKYFVKGLQNHFCLTIHDSACTYPDNVTKLYAGALGYAVEIEKALQKPSSINRNKNCKWFKRKWV